MGKAGFVGDFILGMDLRGIKKNGKALKTPSR